VADFDINQLCERARVTPRTVHFYVQQGLLPPAGSPGPGARYTEGHVSRIRLIRLLQKQHLPLAEIAKRTKGLTDEQVDALVAETRQRRAEGRGSSALDYIRGVLSEQSGPTVDLMRAAAASPQRDRSLRPRTPRWSPATPPPTARSQWERFTLADGIELHVRRPLSLTEQRQLEKLMSAARKVFEDSEGEGQ
jgi:DNA-binding transcriptional MerR regulator